MKFVRIRPFNKQRGQLVRRYVYRGFRFEVERGWYRVEDDAVAEALAKVLTFPDNPDSKPVFDVATEEEATTLSLREYEAANPERKIQEAIAGAQSVTEEKMPLEAPDAPKPKRGKKAAAEPEPEEVPAEPEAADKGGKGSGKKTPFGT